MVRTAFVLSGGGYSTFMLQWTWQLLDPHYLDSALVRTILALHIQPPFFNLFIGSVYAWFPLPPALTLQVAYLACGAVIVGGLYLLLLDLRFSAVAASIGAVVVAMNPTVLSYENSVAYEVPVIAMLVCIALFMVRWVRSGHMAWFAALALVSMTAVMTRALFHPVWMIGVFGLALVARPPSRRWWSATMVMILAFTPIVGWMAKNQWLIGEFTLSSWFGMNLSKSTLAILPLHDIDALIAEGRLSPDARVLRFGRLSAYSGREPGCRSAHSNPALAESTYTEVKRPNYNAYCYVALYREAQDDAIAAFKARPRRFLATRRTSFVLHFTEAGPMGSPVTPVTRALDRVSHVVLAEPTIDPSDLHFDLILIPQRSRFSWVLLAGTFLVLVRAAAALRGVRRRDPSAAGWVFVGGTVAFVLVTSMLFEFGENGRFGLLVQPFVVAVTMASIAAAVGKVVRHRARAGASPVSSPETRDQTSDAPTAGNGGLVRSSAATERSGLP